MMCGMCEAHVADAIRKAFPDAKKVSASRKAKEATFLSEDVPGEDAVIKAIEDTGYTAVSVRSGPYKKRGLFGR